jgi:hypothetical protein
MLKMTTDQPRSNFFSSIGFMLGMWPRPVCSVYGTFIGHLHPHFVERMQSSVYPPTTHIERLLCTTRIMTEVKSHGEKYCFFAKLYKCRIFICQEPVASGLVVMWDLPASPPPISTMQAAPMHICLYIQYPLLYKKSFLNWDIQYSHANLIVTWHFIRPNCCR